MGSAARDKGQGGVLQIRVESEELGVVIQLIHSPSELVYLSEGRQGEEWAERSIDYLCKQRALFLTDVY